MVTKSRLEAAAHKLRLAEKRETEADAAVKVAREMMEAAERLADAASSECFMARAEVMRAAQEEP